MTRLSISESAPPLMVLLGLSAVISACRSPGCGDSPAEGASRPSVVWIVIDALRPDHLGCYGYHRPTSPFIDELAASAVRFDRAFAQESYTQASVASYFTSTYPANNGVLYNTPGADRLSDDYWTVAELARQAGLSTASWSFNPHFKREFNLTQGFEHVDNTQRKWDYTLPHHVIHESARQIHDKLRAYLEAQGPGPRLLYLHYQDVHDPYVPPPDYIHRFEEQLFDIEHDFGETADVIDDHLDIAATLRAMGREVLGRHAHTPEEGAVELQQKTLESLRSLGYVE